MSELIVAEGLSFDYETSNKTVNALKNIDLSIFSGEYIALIGANGSGKSTLIKHFNALLTPTRGKVRVGDLCTCQNENKDLIRQMCGMIFQNPDNQIVANTVKEDVAFGPENLGLSSNEIISRVSEAMETTGISQFAAMPPHHLSGGQKQLVAIAGILAMRPKCMLLDEPTSLLDPRGQKEVLDLMDKLNRKEGITIINVTHSMEEASRANRILVMFEGEIVCDGTPSKVMGDAEKLKKWKLETPMAVAISDILRSSGHKIPKGIINIDDLVEVLCS